MTPVTSTLRNGGHVNLKSLVESLGGPSHVAKALNLSPASVTDMCRRGTFPPKHYSALKALAARRLEEAQCAVSHVEELPREQLRILDATENPKAASMRAKWDDAWR